MAYHHIHMNIILISVFSLLIIPALVLGVVIVKSPGENVWVEKGKDTVLTCMTDTNWQWCEWEHEAMTGEKQKYQTGQKYTTLKTGDDQIQFTELSETSCGLHISMADPMKHQVIHYAIIKDKQDCSTKVHDD